MDMNPVTRSEFEEILDQKFSEFAALMDKHFTIVHERIDGCATKQDLKDLGQRMEQKMTHLGIRLETKMDTYFTVNKSAANALESRTSHLESAVFGRNPA